MSFKEKMHLSVKGDQISSAVMGPSEVTWIILEPPTQDGSPLCTMLPRSAFTNWRTEDKKNFILYKFSREKNHNGW